MPKVASNHASCSRENGALLLLSIDGSSSDEGYFGDHNLERRRLALCCQNDDRSLTELHVRV